MEVWSMMDICGACGRTPAAGEKPLLRCSNCKMVSYCNKSCQITHFKSHKSSCAQYRERQGSQRPPVHMLPTPRSALPIRNSIGVGNGNGKRNNNNNNNKNNGNIGSNVNSRNSNAGGKSTVRRHEDSSSDDNSDSESNGPMPGLGVRKDVSSSSSDEGSNNGNDSDSDSDSNGSMPGLATRNINSSSSSDEESHSSMPGLAVRNNDSSSSSDNDSESSMPGLIRRDPNDSSDDESSDDDSDYGLGNTASRTVQTTNAAIPPTKLLSPPQSTSTSSLQKQTKRKKRSKKGKKKQTTATPDGSVVVESEAMKSRKRMNAEYTCTILYHKLQIDANNYKPPTSFSVATYSPERTKSVKELISQLYSSLSDGTTPLWLFLDQKYTSPLYEALLQVTTTSTTKPRAGAAGGGGAAAAVTVADKNDKVETIQWFQSHANQLLNVASEHKRHEDIAGLLSLKVKNLLSTTLIRVFQSLPKGQGRGGQFNNNLAKTILEKCEISIENRSDVNAIMHEVSDRVGKKSCKAIKALAKEGEKRMVANNSNKSAAMKNGPTKSVPDLKEEKVAAVKEKVVKKKDNFKSKFESRIVHALELYRKKLEKLKNREGETVPSKGQNSDENQKVEDEQELRTNVSHGSKKRLSSSEVVAQMIEYDTLSEEEQKVAYNDMETNMDLSDFNLESEWTIEMTEEAHKWFRKHKKRRNDYCQRVICRLKILGTGRWPYVLCKPLNHKKSKARLYESKIDSGNRIIWEVAISFSPRRSSAGNPFFEQVIRVWDIVDDHDKLTGRIDLAVDRIERREQIERSNNDLVVDRIEQSLLRGEKSAIYSELDGNDTSSQISGHSNITVPKVFAMKQNTNSNSSKPEILEKTQNKHYPPANPNPLRYTLLKFYHLNSDAVKMLLESNDESIELPFTPGPKEHEIIHHKSNPQRSILLMGRSGTGKTTCLVFRMWSQYMAYIEKSRGRQPRQLFLTKNNILRDEVERSFGNMGLAYRKRVDTDLSLDDEFNDLASSRSAQDDETESKFPLFLTSSEWLDVLDRELPGKSFFTQKELKKRSHSRNDDTTARRIEAAISKANDVQVGDYIRSEMNYRTFRSHWQKVSRAKTELDPAMVWREIYTYIKGSVSALKLDDPDRDDPTNRFLSLEEYLMLPRKQSRLNTEQRHTVYAMYETYEKIKKEKNYYDSMDVVYNLAGRVTQFLKKATNLNSNDNESLLPIDSLFIDEVQDFTMAELYLLTKLSRDPNNLMLAGDTAQSITEGVAFRFTDVRQIFYELFGGIEPDLLQLTHNYRSHSGILRMAACVVELLYFFFSDSLDRLPPDLGMFPGPKPIIMEIESPKELFLMLDGSEREKTRIEFGAHQVIIVRNDKVKQSLADEFGVDKDWIMTVQESKGLEFDDVLIYNFFTESEAGDMWRVVSNYTEKDVAEYYSQVSSESSEVEKFEWDSLMSNTARHLDFSYEQHKILETELKILYTAITRARVNIFMTETDSDLSSPMFKYFKQRCVADEVVKENKEGVSNIPVFGKMSTPEDWKERGEYYLRDARGENKLQRLRLAAKCFGRAGETKRQDNTLVLIDHEEEQEQETSTTKQGTHKSPEQRERLYGMATRLLEADDIAFLDKAGLCLYQSGDIEKGRSASILELHARLSYAKRDKENLIPDTIEQENFNSAAKIYEDLSDQESSDKLRRQHLFDAVRNYLCSGTMKGWKKVGEILDSNVMLLKDSTDLRQLLSSLAEPHAHDPISYVHQQLIKSPAKTQLLRISITNFFQSVS